MTTYLYGTSGNDTLQATTPDDYYFSGGAGDDLIIATGDDVIGYFRGDGHDTIDGAQGITELRFLNGVRFSDLTFSIQGSDLRIDIGGISPAGSITVLNFEENFLSSITSMYDATPLTWQNVLDLAGYVPPPNNVLTGTEGADTLVATVTQTEVNGLGGNDTITTSDSNTLVNGGAGSDTVYGGDGDNIYHGGDGNDWISDGDGDGYLYGDAGNDTLRGFGGDDHIYGGDGNDILMGNGGTDVIYGGAGNDTISAASGGPGQTVSGDAGDDSISASGDEQILYNRGDGHDSIGNATGISNLHLGTGIALSDLAFSVVNGNLRIDVTGANAGSITVQSISQYQLSGLSLADGGSLTWQQMLDRVGAVLNGTAGNDVLVAGPTHTEINGLGGDDTITAGNFNTLINAGDGNDTVYGGSATDTIYTGSGNNIVHAGGGYDSVFGGDGNDTLYGDAGNDTLRGYDGNDTIYGGDGDDFLIGNGGTDVIYGGAGNDVLAVNVGGPGQTVSGDQGDDSIDAAGDETVLYNRGDGHDSIGNAVGLTDLQLGSGIALSDLSFSLQDGGLRIDIAGADAGSITVQDISQYYLSGLYLHDGSSLTWQQMLDLADPQPGPVLTGTAGDDSLTGVEETLAIYGLAGNDTISGSASTTYLDGGEGNDNIYDNGYGSTVLGGDGNDNISAGTSTQVTGGKGDDSIGFVMSGMVGMTYAAGDGNDSVSMVLTGSTLYMTGGIQLSDLSFSRPNNDQLVIDIASVGGEAAGQISVAGLYLGGYINSIVFEDSSSINWAGILDLANGGGSSLQAEPLIQAMASFGADSGSAAMVPGDIQQDNYMLLAPAVA